MESTSRQRLRAQCQDSGVAHIRRAVDPSEMYLYITQRVLACIL